MAKKIYIKLTPNAKQDKVDGIFVDSNGQEYLKVYTTVIPEDNKANKQLIKIMAKYLSIPKRDITLIAGHKSRLKILELSEF